MSHKTIKPDLDLILARFAIFGILAILFAVPSVNGHPSWLTWVVMLWGVFSIFEAAIKADEAFENVIDSQTMIENLTKRVIIQHRIIKYQDQKIDQLIEMRGKEIKELKASHHGEMIGHEVHFKKIKKERDELKKRVNGALKLIPSLKAENDLHGCYQVDHQRELIEQALKGGEA